MKSFNQALKTLTVSLTLVYGVSSVSFAADASPSDKLMAKAELMQLLREGGLPEGITSGKSAAGDDCKLTINTKAGEEKVALQSTADETEQQLIFENYVSDIPFLTRESKKGLTIIQDFGDSSETVTIDATAGDSVSVSFTEYIAGDERSLTCIFK